MNFLNRILIILLTLLAMAVSIVVCLEVFQVISIEALGFSKSILEMLNVSFGNELAAQLPVGGICLCVFLVCSVLLYFEVRNVFAGDRYVVISNDESGKLEISHDCIERLVNFEAKRLDGIVASSSNIKNKKTGFHIQSDVTIGKPIDLTETSRVLQQHLKTEIKEKLGLSTASVSIRAKAIDLSEPKRSAT